MGLSVRSTIESFAGAFIVWLEMSTGKERRAMPLTNRGPVLGVSLDASPSSALASARTLLLAHPAARSPKKFDSRGMYSKVSLLILGQIVASVSAAAVAVPKWVHFASLLRCLILGRLSIWTIISIGEVQLVHSTGRFSVTYFAANRSPRASACMESVACGSWTARNARAEGGLLMEAPQSMMPAPPAVASCFLRKEPSV